MCKVLSVTADEERYAACLAGTRVGRENAAAPESATTKIALPQGSRLVAAPDGGARRGRGRGRRLRGRLSLPADGRPRALARTLMVTRRRRGRRAVPRPLLAAPLVRVPARPAARLAPLLALAVRRAPNALRPQPRDAHGRQHRRAIRLRRAQDSRVARSRERLNLRARRGERRLPLPRLLRARRGAPRGHTRRRRV